MKQFRRAIASYWRILYGNRLLTVYAILVAGLSGCAEALGLASLLPLLSSSTSADWAQLWPIVVAIAGFLVLATMLKLLSDYLIGRVTTDVEFRKRVELMTALADSRWARVARLTQGEITSAVMSEATQLSNGVYGLLVGLANAIVLLALASIAAFLTPSLLVITAIFAALSISIFLSQVRRVRVNERNISVEGTEIGEAISSTLHDLKYLRESGTEDWWLTRSIARAERLGSLRKRQIWLPSATRSVVDAVGAVFLAGVIAVAITWLNDLPSAIVFVALFYRIIPRLQAIQANASVAIGQLSWDARWNQRMSSLTDPMGASPGVDSVASKSKRDLHVAVDAVSFQYQAGAPLLESVNIHIMRGQHVGIVGASGGGKTTLLDIMLGMLPPQSGTVEISGRALNEEGWRAFRSTVGLVPQDVPIIRGTLADNVCWERSFDKANADEAAHAAQLSEFVGSRRLNWDDPISSRSHGLSGGQRQRIGLARAFYRNPELLILDEATSALDSSTEEALLKTIRARWDGLTVIVVSHRPAALVGLDVIYKVENAKVERVV